MIHELKTWKEYFSIVYRGDKPFELRKNDRDFCAGHELLLKEYNNETKEYTGRILHRRITYVYRGGEGGDFGLKEGYAILGLEKI
jgi:hypothetical protein